MRPAQEQKFSITELRAGETLTNINFLRGKAAKGLV